MLIFKKYNILQITIIIFHIIMSKLFINKKVRIVKYPFNIINKHNIAFGINFTSGKNLRIECLGDLKQKKLLLGDNIKINDYVHIACIEKIIIGNNVLIGSNVLITDHLHGSYQGDNQDSPYSAPDERKLSSQAVSIGDNCWIGDMVSIMPNVNIGSGVIIGANSVVTKDIPNNTIAVGNPCKVIKEYNIKTKKWEKLI